MENLTNEELKKEYETYKKEMNTRKTWTEAEWEKIHEYEKELGKRNEMVQYTAFYSED